jgi:hypothetical protein
VNDFTAIESRRVTDDMHVIGSGRFQSGGEGSNNVADSLASFISEFQKSIVARIGNLALACGPGGSRDPSGGHPISERGVASAIGWHKDKIRIEAVRASCPTVNTVTSRKKDPGCNDSGGAGSLALGSRKEQSSNGTEGVFTISG